MNRKIIALVLAVTVVILWFYFFNPSPKKYLPNEQRAKTFERPIVSSNTTLESPFTPNLPRDITVETDSYQAILTEEGGCLKSLFFKDCKGEAKFESTKNMAISLSPQLSIFRDSNKKGTSLIFTADKTDIVLNKTQHKEDLTMSAITSEGLKIVRTYTFKKKSFLIHLVDKIISSDSSLNVNIDPRISLSFESISDLKADVRLLALLDDKIFEKKLVVNGINKMYLTGTLAWAGLKYNKYDKKENISILNLIIPQKKNEVIELSYKNIIFYLTQGSQVLEPNSEREYIYDIYFGPTDLDILRSSGRELHRAVRHVWLYKIARSIDYFKNLF